jgi:hypothetical protein
VDSLVGKQVEHAKEDSQKDWHGHPTMSSSLMTFPYLCLQFGKNILDVIMNFANLPTVKGITCRHKDLEE